MPLEAGTPPSSVSIPGSIAVYFDPATPSVGATFSGSMAVYFDKSNPSVNIGTPTVSSITNTVGVFFDRGNPSVNVGTPTVSSITNTVGVYFDRGNPSVNVGTPTIAAITASVGVYFDRGNPSVNIQSQTSTINVALDPGHTLGSIAAIGSITNTVAVYFDRGNPTVTANVGTGSMAVFFSGSNPSINPSVAYNSGVVGVTTQRIVHAVDVAGSVNIVSQGLAFLNIAHTASIFTTSGSASGVALGGNTIISPSANYSFKIFAFQLTSTAQTNLLARFTNGASSSPTEYWRMPLWAPAQGVMGGNLAVTPPGYLWATGASTTLSLLLDSASLVHYSVSYVKETS